MTYEHSIGNTLETLTPLDQLSAPLTFPKSRYREFAALKTSASGQTIGLGQPEADWEWTYLTLAQRNQLREFFSGASTNLYIRALKNDGSYANFSAIAHWPAEEQRGTQYVLGFALRFTHLTEIPDEV